MKVAFVLGNGTSRSFITIPELKDLGTVYACNAVFRNDSPDHLIAVDARMVLEITRSGYHLNNKVWTNKKKSTSSFSDVSFVDEPNGWSSGPTALWLAAAHSYDKIYILGFDYSGVDDGTKINNVFAGTPNYKSKNSKATYFGNWLSQTEKTIKNFPNTQFIRIIQPDNYCPPGLNSFENFNTITVSDFFKHTEFHS
jgi:hypothetical protein